MREIKFRAWAIVSGNDGWQMCYEPTYQSLVYEWLGNKERGVKFMQYTGLKDKNGKEIYEGDIVAIGISDTCKDNLIRVVVYDAPQFRVVDKNNTYGNFNIVSDKNNVRGVIKTEVVGNIYENPELLKEGDVNG